MQVDSELEPPQPSTSTTTTPISATKRKFGYRQGLPLREHISAAEPRQRPIETSFVRCCMMSALVRGLACTECSEPTLKIRAIDRRLGLVCLLETYCTTCGAVLNSTLSSDRVEEEKAGNVPFVVVRQAVAATMDMGVGHAGLVKLCRFMDMEPLQHKSYSRHVKAVTAANMTVVSSLFDDAAKTVRQMYRERDPHFLKTKWWTIYINGKTVDYRSIAWIVITAVLFLPVKFVIAMLRNLMSNLLFASTRLFINRILWNFQHFSTR